MRKGKVNIVVYYSFFLCVVFGDEIVVEEFIVEFDDIFVKIIFFNVRCVYYSYLIIKVSLKFKEILKGILWNKLYIFVIFIVIGKLVDEMFGFFFYWVVNVFELVFF